MWRYRKRILNRIGVLHRKARNIVVDYCWKLARGIVFKAYRRRHAIALEDFEHLNESIGKKNSSARWKLALFTYRKLQHSIIAKAAELNAPELVVDPRKTSSTCPICGERLEYVYRLAICGTCGFKRDRDAVGAANIWLKTLQTYVAGSGFPQNTSAMKDETRQSMGTKMRG